jgi:hypothetical protein
MEKEWYRSKTIWFNLIFLVAAALGVVMPAAGYTDFQPSQEVAELGTVVVILTNLILRTITKSSIK